MNTKTKTFSILAARYIVRGDFHTARALLQGRRSYSVAEYRALHGALRAAKERYGAPSFDIFSS